MMEYIYKGDRMTDPELKGRACKGVRRADGKCIRAGNGNFLVQFDDGAVNVVLGRMLRKIKVT